MIDEWNDMPDDPRLLTYRGRYVHLDEELSKLAGFNSLPAGTEVSVLDYAGGVREYGSPTAHDLHERITADGLIPEITVFDTYIPDGLNPAKPDIAYTNKLESVARKEFDIVRMMWLVGHLRGDEYNRARYQAVSRVRDGGFFVCVQLLVRPGEHPADRTQWASLPAVIKIMQRQGSSLVPVALLPAPLHPWPGWKPRVDELVGYHWQRLIPLYRAWLADVRAGKTPIRREVGSRNFQITLAELSRYSARALDSEQPSDMLASGVMSKRHEIGQWDPIKSLASLARGSQRRFARGIIRGIEPLSA